MPARHRLQACGFAHPPFGAGTGARPMMPHLGRCGIIVAVLTHAGSPGGRERFAARSPHTTPSIAPSLAPARQCRRCGLGSMMPHLGRCGIIVAALTHAGSLGRESTLDSKEAAHKGLNGPFAGLLAGTPLRRHPPGHAAPSSWEHRNRLLATQRRLTPGLPLRTLPWRNPGPAAKESGNAPAEAAGPGHSVRDTRFDGLSRGRGEGEHQARERPREVPHRGGRQESELPRQPFGQGLLRSEGAQGLPDTEEGRRAPRADGLRPRGRQAHHAVREGRHHGGREGDVQEALLRLRGRVGQRPRRG